MSSVIDLRAYVNPSVVETLALVDLQQEYVSSPRVLALEDTKGPLANCRAALAHARASGMPVAFVRWIDRTPLFNKATRFSRWIFLSSSSQRPQDFCSFSSAFRVISA